MRYAMAITRYAPLLRARKIDTMILMLPPPAA